MEALTQLYVVGGSEETRLKIVETQSKVEHPHSLKCITCNKSGCISICLDA